MKEYYIDMIGIEHNKTSTIITEKFSDSCQIEFNFQDIYLKSEATDFFEALCQIRKKLEPLNLIPYCYGASLNVYPSGMGRDMGAGLKAYKMQIGQHASGENLVNIFDKGDGIFLSSVEEQKEYFKKWIGSERS